MRRGIDSILNTYIVPVAFGAAAGSACEWAAGSTLGLVLGPLAFVPLFVPALVTGAPSRRDKLFAVVSFSLALSAPAVWTFHDVRALLWTVLLLAFSAGLAGLTRAFVLFSIPKAFATALSTTIGLAWLSWPVWISPWLGGMSAESTVARLVIAHPLFATNALFIKLGVWTEMGIAYRLTNLNQDVAYALPGKIWPCVMLHASFALPLLMTRRSTVPTENASRA